MFHFVDVSDCVDWVAFACQHCTDGLSESSYYRQCTHHHITVSHPSRLSTVIDKSPMKSAPLTVSLTLLIQHSTWLSLYSPIVMMCRYCGHLPVVWTLDVAYVKACGPAAEDEATPTSSDTEERCTSALRLAVVNEWSTVMWCTPSWQAVRAAVWVNRWIIEYLPADIRWI